MAKSSPKGPGVELPPMDREQMSKWWLVRVRGYRGYLLEMEAYVLGGVAGLLGAAAYAVLDQTFDDGIGLLVFAATFFAAIWVRWKFQNTRYEMGLERLGLPADWRPSDDYRADDGKKGTGNRRPRR